MQKTKKETHVGVNCVRPLAKNKGVTLVALVVTIIILLILAGVGISVLTGDNGIITKAKYSKMLSEANNKKEAIEVLMLGMKAKAATGEITLQEIKEQIIKEGIAEEDKIVINEEEKTIKIIEQDYIVKIQDKGNGEYEVTVEIEEGIGKGKTEISYTINPEEGTLGESVEITIIGTNEKQNIVKMKYPDGTEKTYEGTKRIEERYTVTTNGNYTFEIEAASGRKVSKTIEIRNIKISGANLVIGYTPTEATKGNVVVTISGVQEGYTLEYQIVEVGSSPVANNWLEYKNEITLEGNNDIYARQKDKMGITGEYAVGNVQNIDKIAPNEFTPTTGTITANSIQINANATDTGSVGCTASNTGIKQCSYYVGGELKYTGPETTYTATGLVEGTNYTIYVIAEDKAGNTRTSNSITVVAKEAIYAKLYTMSDGTGDVLEFSSNEGYVDTSSELTLKAEYGNIIDNNSNSKPWNDTRSSIIKVKIIGEIKPKNTSYWFSGCNNLTQIENIENIDTSNVTSMRGMFYKCGNLTNLDVSNFDTSNVTSMHSMFYYCRSLTNLDVSKFVTSNVTSMYLMFFDCRSLTSIDVSDFDTSNVTSMYAMFKDCSSLTNIDVSNFDTSNVTDMSSMFYYCSKLTNLDLSNFDTSNVTDMNSMFCYCRSLTNLAVSNFNTSNATDMHSMFGDCSSLTSLDLSNFVTSNVTSMRDMFVSCSKLTTIYVGSKWTTANADTNYMFSNCGTSSVTVKP